MCCKWSQRWIPWLEINDLRLIGWSFCDLGRVDLDRVAFFVTCFSKQQIKDWRETDAQPFKKSWNKNEMHGCCCRCCSCRILCSGNPQPEQWPTRLSHSPHRHMTHTCCRSIDLMFFLDSGCNTNSRMQQMLSIFVSTPHSLQQSWVQVVVSLLDAFRKRGLRSERTFQVPAFGFCTWLRTETKGLKHPETIAQKQTLNSSDSIETSCSLGSAVECCFQCEAWFNTRFETSD